MAKALRHADRARMQPPMTPMIDCTFNLLIFFLPTLCGALPVNRG